MVERRRRMAGAMGGKFSDVTAPALSSPTDAASGATTAALGVTTNEGNGTLYWVVSTSATPPSAAQVKAGNDHTGSAAVDSGSQAVVGTGVQSISGGATGLTAGTMYYAHLMHEDAAANQSSVSSADGFMTYITDLDQLDNLYSIASLKLVRAAYAGDLVRLRRVSDNVEADFGPDGTGWIDAAAITTWLGGSSARVVTVYDQSGNSRVWTQATAGSQPFLDLSATYPQMDFQGAESLSGAALVGWLNNRSANSSVAVRVHDAVGAGSTNQVFMFSVTASGASRFGANSNSSGTVTFETRRQDGDSLNSLAGIAADTSWRVHINVADWAAGIRKHRVDSLSNSSSGLSTGSSSATDSLVGWWGRWSSGGFLDGKCTSLFLFTDALTDAEIAALITFGADLKAA